MFTDGYERIPVPGLGGGVLLTDPNKVRVDQVGPRVVITDLATRATAVSWGAQLGGRIVRVFDDGSYCTCGLC